MIQGEVYEQALHSRGKYVQKGPCYRENAMVRSEHIVEKYAGAGQQVEPIARRYGIADLREGRGRRPQWRSARQQARRHHP